MLDILYNKVTFCPVFPLLTNGFCVIIQNFVFSQLFFVGLIYSGGRLHKNAPRLSKSIYGGYTKWHKKFSLWRLFSVTPTSL